MAFQSSYLSFFFCLLRMTRMLIRFQFFAVAISMQRQFVYIEFCFFLFGWFRYYLGPAQAMFRQQLKPSDGIYLYLYITIFNIDCCVCVRCGWLDFFPASLFSGGVFFLFCSVGWFMARKSEGGFCLLNDVRSNCTELIPCLSTFNY